MAPVLAAEPVAVEPVAEVPVAEVLAAEPEGVALGPLRTRMGTG